MKRLATWYPWVLLLPAVLPLFFWQGTMYPLLAPKTFALRAIGIIALALFAYLVAAGHSFYWGRLRRPATWIPGALLAVAYAASLLGLGFYHSFWSTFERGDGLLMLTISIGFFYLLLISAGEEWLAKLSEIVAWVASLSAVYLVLQWLTVVGNFSLPFIVTPNGRVGGTLGNAAFLASYLGVALFMTLAAARARRGATRTLLYIGAALEVISILLTATRGTILALGGVAVAFVIYEAVKGSGKTRVYARSALVALLVCAGLFFAFRAELAKAPFEPVRRIASISLSDPTVASRLFAWKNIFHESLARPLTGYGAEHVSVLFDKTYDPSAISDEWFDRSHDAYLDYFAQFGFFGLALYLSLIALFIVVGVRLARAGDAYGFALLGAIGVYALQNVFVFDTAMTLWLMLALLATGLVRASFKESEGIVLGRVPVVGGLLAVLILALLIPVVIQPLRANLLAFESYQYQVADVARSNAAATNALALGTYADLELGYDAYFMYTDEQINRLSGAERDAAYQNAVNLLTHDFNRYPYDARTAVYLTQVLSAAPPGVPPDQALLSEALARSIEASPKRAQPWYILANLSIGDANTHPVRSPERSAGYAAAKDILGKYIALVPNMATPHFVLAQLDLASGDTAAAAREAAKGKELYTENLEAARRAVAYYESVEDLPNTGRFLEDMVKLSPGDATAAYELAKVRFLLGDKAGSEAIVAELRKTAPAIIESDPAFKAAITDYEQSLK